MTQSASIARRALLALVITVALPAIAGATTSQSVALPPGNAAQQWNTIAQDTIVNTPGMFQNEALLYMSYTQAAVYDAVTAIEGGYASYGPQIAAPPGASADAAVTQAAYRTLIHYFPTQASTLGPVHDEALVRIADGAAKTDGIAVGNAAAADIIALRAGDGRERDEIGRASCRERV